MFNHALKSVILYGVSLDNWGKMCHLQYTDVLLVIIAGGLEDLRIIKFILFLFEGMSGLTINFHKSCLFEIVRIESRMKPQH